MNIVIATRSAYPNGITSQRARLRESICARSLAMQTDHDFRWLVSVEPGESALTQFRRFDRIYPLLITLTCAGQWAQSVENLGLSDVRMVRLDDDDAIAHDFVERLRTIPFAPGQWCVCPNGYRTLNGRCEPKNHPTNQFVSLDIPNGSGRHVYDINHRDVTNAKIVDTRPAWLWTRHNESKSPGGRQRATRPLSTLTKWFDVDLQTLAEIR